MKTSQERISIYQNKKDAAAKEGASLSFAFWEGAIQAEEAAERTERKNTLRAKMVWFLWGIITTLSILFIINSI